MGKSPKCVCGTCRLCKSRETNRRIYAGHERMPWPAEYFAVHQSGKFQQYDGASFAAPRIPSYSAQE